MAIAFILTMPNRASWNGRWSGEDNLYAIVLSPSREQKARCAALIGKSFYYNFGDGWGASISVEEVKSAEAVKLRKKSKGFCGYDWMVRSLIAHGEIRTQ